ncbi:MAG: hypothetical protein K0V04_31075 [Deltaproteobacteria bacterium]|nr:hypothetical protein [Deltaproteobacteria bacterium]
MKSIGTISLIGLCIAALSGCDPGADSDEGALRALQLTDVQGEVFFGGTYAEGELDLVESIEDAVIAANWTLDDVVLRSDGDRVDFPEDGLASLADLANGDVVSIESEDGQPLMELQVMGQEWIHGLPEATATRFPLCGGALPPR